MEILKNNLRFVAVDVGALATLPHLLRKKNGVSLAPQRVAILTPGFRYVNSTTTDLTVQNVSAADDTDCDVYVEHWHSIEDARAPGMMLPIVTGELTGIRTGTVIRERSTVDATLTMFGNFFAGTMVAMIDRMVTKLNAPTDWICDVMVEASYGPDAATTPTANMLAVDLVIDGVLISEFYLAFNGTIASGPFGQAYGLTGTGGNCQAKLIVPGLAVGDHHVVVQVGLLAGIAGGVGCQCRSGTFPVFEATVLTIEEVF